MIYKLEKQFLSPMQLNYSHEETMKNKFNTRFLQRIYTDIVENVIQSDVPSQNTCPQPQVL